MMRKGAINIYGDRFDQAVTGCGVDVGSQRTDDLDQKALEWVHQVAPLRKVWALDAACGRGGQAIRLAQAGARVVAFDLADLREDIQASAAKEGISEAILFFQGDLLRLDEVLDGRTFDLICCQRAIHYLPWKDAVAVATIFARLLCPGGKLFLSASGIKSELGEGYCRVARETRYSPLSDTMIQKHGIHGNVCLYDEEDLAELFHAAGLLTEDIFSSSFGNVKGIAVKHD